MKKHLGSALVGVLASSLFVQAQSAGGAAGGAAAGSAGGAVGAPGAGTAAGVNARAGNANAVGAAGINQPTANTPIGGASVINNSPNTIGGATIAQNPGSVGTVGTLPGSGTLPTGSGAQQATANTGLGNPAQNATISGLNTADATVVNTSGNAQAGIPLTTLPANLQQSINRQLGNAQVQTISRDDLANGSVFRVTATQNGVPVESRFAANGAFLGSSPISGTATSFVTPAATVVPGTAVVPTGGVIFDSLPVAVQNTVRSQTGNGRIASISPQGQSFLVNYDVNGQPTTMLIGPDGRVLRAGPTAVGTAPGAATGAGAITNSTRTSSVQLNDLPESARNAIRDELGTASLQTITREQRATGDVYVVSGRDDKGFVQITVDSDGKVLRDSRQLSVVAVGTPRVNSEVQTGIPFARVPKAVQEAIRAYAAASDIRSVSLGTDNGKTVYDVIFMRDGRRDRMLVGKDGNMVRIEQDVSATLDASKEGPRLAVGDLPADVRDTIRRQTKNVNIQSVETKKIGDQVTYSVRYETNGVPVELLVDSQGAVVYPDHGTTSDAPNAPRPAPLPVRGEEVVKVLSTTDKSAVGSPASSETTAVTWNNSTLPATIATETRTSGQKVALSDVPQGVQTSAKQLANDGIIESINPSLDDDGVVYDVTISKEGNRQIFRLNKDGVVQPKK